MLVIIENAGITLFQTVFQIGSDKSNLVEVLRLHFFKRRKIVSHFLHSNDIEVVDDFRNVVERLALTRSILSRLELTYVPGCQAEFA